MEVILRSGPTLAWLVDVTWQPEWSIACSVVVNKDEWQETVAEFPIRQFEARDFPYHLAHAIQELIDSEDGFGMVQMYGGDSGS